jgi:hypothetical protein
MEKGVSARPKIILKYRVYGIQKNHGSNKAIDKLICWNCVAKLVLWNTKNPILENIFFRLKGGACQFLGT